MNNLELTKGIQLCISASLDGTVRLWDCVLGTMQGVVPLLSTIPLLPGGVTFMNVTDTSRR